MFTLELVPGGHERISGTAALDVCRRLGIADSTWIVWERNKGIVGYKEPSCEVDENFARAWFTPEQTTSGANIPLAMLTRGDVRYCNESNTWAICLADLSPERIKQLYIACRFAGCRAEVERLTQERDALKDRLAHYEPEPEPELGPDDDC